jgi:hypothetical protein
VLNFTPSMQLAPVEYPQFSRSNGGASLMEVSAFMTEQLDKQLDKQRAHDEKMRQEAKADREELEAKLEHQRHENAKLRERALLREQALVVALQSRVQALHATQLLADEELYCLEDLIADGCEVLAVDDGGDGGDDRVAQMLALSERMAADGAFARQLRRKFV